MVHLGLWGKKRQSDAIANDKKDGYFMTIGDGGDTDTYKNTPPYLLMGDDRQTTHP